MAIRYVVFTKDRRMQFRAFCESINHYVNPSEIFVVTPKKYEGFDDIKNLNWVVEHGSFDKTYKDLIESFDSKDLLCSMVDDLIWYKSFDKEVAEQFLLNNEDVIGISLRLGLNTAGVNYAGPFNVWELEDNKPMVAKFDWRGKLSHWAVGFELSCSIYRVSTVKNFIKAFIRDIKIPNCIESLGMDCLYRGVENRPKYAIFAEPSFCGCSDTNRCQDLYKNNTNGNQYTTIENLEKMYTEGYRINWKKYNKFLHSDPFTGTINLEFLK